MDAHSSEHARGVASYYYGTGSGASSTVGEQFANLARREVIARTGMLDLGSHAKTWDLLRMTRMPAVRLDCGYLSHRVDRLLLLDARRAQRHRAAVLAAVQRLYLPAEADPPTGTFVLPETAVTRPIRPAVLRRRQVLRRDGVPTLGKVPTNPPALPPVPVSRGRT